MAAISNVAAVVPDVWDVILYQSFELDVWMYRLATDTLLLLASLGAVLNVIDVDPAVVATVPVA